MSYDFACYQGVLSTQELSVRPLIHGSVWVKMHNEFIRGDWCNHKRYCLNYWRIARPIRSLWNQPPSLSTELANLIKCTKSYTLTSPSGAIMAPEIERSPLGVFLLPGRRLLVSVSWLHWLYWFVTAFRVISSSKVKAIWWPGNFFYLFFFYLDAARLSCQVIRWNGVPQ